MRITSGPECAGWHDLETSGAYEWWYFDALTADGGLGLVFIYFAGLPFSPDYLTDHEAGRAPSARDHAALFAAVYEDGRQSCYALNRYRPDAFHADRTRLDVSVGPNRAVASREGNRFVVSVDTPLLLGGRVLRGELAFDRAADSYLPALDCNHDDHEHVWNPIAPRCAVSGKLVVIDRAGTPRELSLDGEGYVDHNYGTRPLTEGIHRWHWGRVHAGRFTAIYYHTESEGKDDQTVLTLSESGRAPSLVEVSRFTSGGWRRRPLCPRFPTTVELCGGVGESMVVLHGVRRRTVDWGPFYMRFLTDFSLDAGGERVGAPGISEYFDPRGLRSRMLRPLIKTRIRRVD